MGTVTPNMNLQKPTLGGDPGTYDDQLNASLDTLDIHDHSEDLGVRIPVGGLNIDAALPFNDNAAIELAAVSFSEQTVNPAALSLFVRDEDNELYWRNASGNNVKITNGASLNLALIGGINGDYSSTDASFYYDEATETYWALVSGPAPNDWARLGVGDVDLYEHDSGIANRVRLRSPDDLAASYEVVFFEDLPSSQAFVHIDQNGQLVATNIVPGDVEFLEEVLHSGNTIFDDGAEFNATADFDDVVDMAGATWLALPPRQLLLDISSGIADTGTDGYTGEYVDFDNVPRWDIPIPLHAFDRITAIQIFYRHNEDTVSFGLYERDMAGTNTSLCFNAVVFSVPGDVNFNLAVSPDSGALPRTLSPDRTYFFRAEALSGTGNRLYGILVTYNRPLPEA